MLWENNAGQVVVDARVYEPEMWEQVSLACFSIFQIYALDIVPWPGQTGSCLHPMMIFDMQLIRMKKVFKCCKEIVIFKAVIIVGKKCLNNDGVGFAVL
jgi:hypothetical protein